MLANRTRRHAHRHRVAQMLNVASAMELVPATVLPAMKAIRTTWTEDVVANVKPMLIAQKHCLVCDSSAQILVLAFAVNMLFAMLTIMYQHVHVHQAIAAIHSTSARKFHKLVSNYYY